MNRIAERVVEDSRFVRVTYWEDKLSFDYKGAQFFMARLDSGLTRERYPKYEVTQFYEGDDILVGRISTKFGFENLLYVIENNSILEGK